MVLAQRFCNVVFFFFSRFCGFGVLGFREVEVCRVYGI